MVEVERHPAGGLAPEARLLENELGLTPKAMRLMLWTIVGDAVAERRATNREQHAAVADVRARVQAVD